MSADGGALGGFWFLLLMVLVVTATLVRNKAGWRAPPGQGRRVMVARPVTIAVLYAILSPLFAHALVGLVSSLASGDWGALPTFLLFAPLSYVFGVIPGAMTGLAVGFTHPWLDRPRDLIALSLMAGAVGGGAAGVLMAGFLETPIEIAQMAALMAVLGSLSAALCGVVLAQFRYLTPKLPPVRPA